MLSTDDKGVVNWQYYDFPLYGFLENAFSYGGIEGLKLYPFTIAEMVGDGSMFGFDPAPDLAPR
jgi:hypothetical protein